MCVDVKVHSLPNVSSSVMLAISVDTYIPLNNFCCVAGSLTGPRPPHYADLDRDGHVVRGSFRGYHRGRGRVMHGKLMPVRGLWLWEACFLCGICPSCVNVKWAAIVLYFLEDLVSDLILEISC